VECNTVCGKVRILFAVQLVNAALVLFVCAMCQSLGQVSTFLSLVFFQYKVKVSNLATPALTSQIPVAHTTF
jgi:hypothetical protein